MLNHEKDLSGGLTGYCRTRAGLSVPLTGRSSQPRQGRAGTHGFLRERGHSRAGDAIALRAARSLSAS
jgi:hypothetical protein